MVNLVVYSLSVAFAVLTVSGQGIPAPPHLYPYGPETGDLMVPASDDGSVEVELSRPFPYFGEVHDKAWVGTNGIVSFIWDTMLLFGIPVAEECVIAPYAIDIDTRANDGRIYYRQTTNSKILGRATRDVRRSFSGASSFSAEWVLIASYNRVTYVGGNSSSPVATFQVVLITNSVQSFVMFNYGDVQFAKAPLDFEYAIMGLDKGDAKHYYLLPDHNKPSAEHIELTTNVGVLGRWLFRVDGNNTVSGGNHPEGVYDCENNSPCTAANRKLNKFFFTYVDMSRFVRCDNFGRCWIRPCALGTLFKASVGTCVQPWRI